MFNPVFLDIFAICCLFMNLYRLIYTFKNLYVCMVLVNIIIKNLFPSKSFGKDAIFHCEGKSVTIVDELKKHGCSNYNGHCRNLKATWGDVIIW